MAPTVLIFPRINIDAVLAQEVAVCSMVSSVENNCLGAVLDRVHPDFKHWQCTVCLNTTVMIMMMMMMTTKSIRRPKCVLSSLQPSRTV